MALHVSLSWWQGPIWDLTSTCISAEGKLSCRSLQCTSSQQSQRSAPVQEPGRSPATQTKLGGKSVIQLMADTRISAQASLSHQSPDLCLDVSKMSSKPASPIPHSNNMKETWRAAQQMRPSSDRLSEHDMGHRVPYFSQNPLAQFRSQISGRHPAGMQPVLFSPLSRAALQMEWYQQQHINHQIGSFMQASQAMRHRLVLPIAPRHIINQMQTHRDISPPCSQRAVPPPKPGLTVHHNSSDDVHNQSPGSARTHSMVPPTSLSCYPSNHKECQVAGTRESNDAEHLERLHRISGALMSKCIDSRYEQHPQIQHPTQENCVRGTGLLREEPGRGCFTPWQKASERMTSPRASTETGQSICKLVRPTPIRAAYKPEQQKEGGESNRQSEEEKDSCDDVEISEDDEPMDDPFPTRASSTAEDFLQYEREKLKNRWAANPDIALVVRVASLPTFCLFSQNAYYRCLHYMYPVWQIDLIVELIIVILPCIPIEAH